MDLQLGQTMTEAFKFISAGTAHTFTFGFQPDKVTFYNLTDWTATAAGLPVSIWFRDQTTAAHAFQQQVIDSAAAQSFNFLDTATNGFTVADTDGGVTSSHKLIDDISKTDPCVVSTSTAHGFQTGQIIRITDLGQVTSATNRGMGEINNQRFRIIVIDSDDFSLKDVITGEPIDSTNFTTYVSGGRVTLESHTISLNNPQVDPYSNSNPYNPNPFEYSAVDYKLTAGSSVMGTDGDVFLIEAIKYGRVVDLGDLLT